MVLGVLMDRHPWCFAGGAASELVQEREQDLSRRLNELLKLQEYGRGYGVEPVIDTTPLE
jgi:hypothetical protein